jgi:hypothetical protein
LKPEAFKANSDKIPSGYQMHQFRTGINNVETYSVTIHWEGFPDDGDIASLQNTWT